MTDSQAKIDYQMFLDVGKIKLCMETLDQLMQESSSEAVQRVLPELASLVQKYLTD